MDEEAEHDKYAEIQKIAKEKDAVASGVRQEANEKLEKQRDLNS